MTRLLRLFVPFAVGAGWTLAAATASADPILVVVPGTADPWLAGMPNGSKASIVDVAPAQSPVQVVGIPIQPDELLQFRAYGLVGHGPRWNEVFGPDGGPFTTHAVGTVMIKGYPYLVPGAENGIANYDVPITSLVGVFLSDNPPNVIHTTPPTLDFRPGGNVPLNPGGGTPAGVNYHALAPQLQQVFFIGDGLDGHGVQQKILVPQGATRLYLGTADGFMWSDNQGAFEVTVANAGHAPEPASLTLLAVGGIVGLLGYRLRRRQAAA